MASEARPPDGDRPTAPSRARSAVENLLPAGIVRRSRSRAPATPHMERSVSSMADSFVDYWGVVNRNPPDLDGAVSPDPAALKDDALTPISNWAHLNYMKTQRNTLRAELKAHQVAGAEAKRSVASLRRLAFRMAVNISVKERQIATSARNLAKSRKSSYLEGRDAEKRVEVLQRALRVEEGRNKEILEALERASMLTLQYASPAEAQHRRPRNPLSPPPSPPTRLSNLSMTALSDPRTPPRSTSSSWNETDWELTPGLASPTDVRTSDSRLIRAKRESDQALSACRRRINELQVECAKSKEDGKALETSKSTLEKEIDEHQARITSLEKARSEVEETLESTRLQLEVSAGLEDGLKQRLRLKNKELTALEQGNGHKEQEIGRLQKETAGYVQQLKDRDDELKELGIRTARLQDLSTDLQKKLDTAEHEEKTLREQLELRQMALDDMQLRLDRGSKYEEILQKKIMEHEQEIANSAKKIETGGSLITTLREQLQQAESSKRNIDEALVTLRTEIATIGAARDMELEALQNEKTKLQEELRCAANALDQEKSDKARLQLELQAAQTRIALLERAETTAQTDFEVLCDDKAAIEADLRDARQTLFTLRELERMNHSELGELKASEKIHEQQLQDSKKRQLDLEDELEQVRSEKQAADHRELQLSVASLQATLKASEQLKASLQAELEQLHVTKNDTNDQLKATLRSKEDTQTELDKAFTRLKLAATESTDLNAQITNLQSRLKESQQAKAEMESRLSAVLDERNQLSALTTELELALKDSRDAMSKVEESLRIVQMDGAASGAEESKEETESKLREVMAARTATEDDLQSAQTRLAMLEAEASRIGSNLSALEAEITEAKRSQLQAEARLHASETARAELNDQVNSTQARLQALTAREQELIEAREGREALQNKLDTAQLELTASRERMSDVEKHSQELAELTSQLTQKSHEQYGDATQRVSIAEREIHETRLKADTAAAATTSRIEELDRQMNDLREANTRLTAAEIDMTEKVNSAEDELQAVRETNKRLEAFLERVEEDMAQAETAFEHSEKRLEEFVDESQAKLDAARNAKLKYKRRLSEKNNELGLLTDQNAILHKQVDQQSQQLEELSQSQSELMEELSTKEKFVSELKSSSDKRMRSMNSAYNDLRSKYERQLQEQHEDGATRLRNELLAKDAAIDGLRDHGEESASAFAALQKEVEALRQDKKAFERLVATLQEKVRHLETLREWQEPVEAAVDDNKAATPIKSDVSRTGPSSILSGGSSTHTQSTRAASALSRPGSISQASVLNERPDTRASTKSKQEDLDAWAKEIERIRMLRDEQAIQLKDNKKARSDLRKSLKDSKIQLHQLEKQSKP
ncbi:hypothetical protein FB567DRAFT_561085 [Paraphoma chrysanthemicola]|uniref:Uncharacterized protein n=1 Tax=Paraphoma chrysanthemicola TaxID=798071 RepID=A0A8K0R3Q3_9PLEO|nr:hypothetical protein FB567DRAFT_561085 [Paraphoma chrysanthemicola]